MTHTELLTDLAYDLGEKCLTPGASDAAKKLLLDALGCAMAARSAPGVQPAIDQMVEWGGKPEATVLLTGDRLPAPHAAFANGTLIHALDLDDVYIPASLHLTSVLVPTMLAAAELAGATGKAALAGLILGIEVTCRIGNATRDKRRGMSFLPSSLDGGFGAVVTAAWLLGLSRAQCVQALGIAYAQLSGNRQALLDCTLTKRIQPAFAARSALWAVALAKRGVTGPHLALEGSCGYYQAYLNGQVPEPEELTQPKDRLEVESVALKHYTSCGACHPAQEATEALLAEEGLTPDQIGRVELFGCGPGGLVGHSFVLGDNPQVEAQFSVAYGVALTLLRGPATLARFTDEAVRADREVIELAQRITFVKRPDDVPEALIEPPPDYSAYNVRPHGIIVHTNDGRRLVRARCPAQTFAVAGVSFDDAVSKFHDCASFSGCCDVARAASIVEAVRELDAAQGIGPLLELLT